MPILMCPHCRQKVSKGDRTCNHCKKDLNRPIIAKMVDSDAIQHL